MKKIINIIKNKWLRDTTLTVLLIAVLLAGFIALNLWVQSLDLTAIDTTKEKLYTLSDTSKEQVKNIDNNVKIIFLGYDDGDATINLAKQYNKINDKINTEIINISERPDLQQKYGIQSSDKVVIIEGNNNTKILTEEDFATYDYTTYDEIDTTEQTLTNSIIGVTLKKETKIYFLTGHNEYSLSSDLTYLQAFLENEVNTVESLNLLTKGVVPEDCSCLVIATPEKDFTTYEVDLLTKYINKGGKILWLNDAELKGSKYPNVQKVLDLFGVGLTEGIILEQDSNRKIGGYPNFMVPNLSYYSEITKNIATDGCVCFINGTKLEFKSDEKLEELGVSTTELVTSSETSLFRKDINNINSSKISSDEQGEFTLGALIEKKIDDKTTSKLIIYSDNIFTTDVTVPVSNNYNYPAIQIYNNKDLILNSVAYLTEREDSIVIRKNTENVTYTATDKQDMIIRIIIFTIPILIIIFGIVVWQIRRRKK